MSLFPSLDTMYFYGHMMRQKRHALERCGYMDQHKAAQAGGWTPAQREILKHLFQRCHKNPKQVGAILKRSYASIQHQKLRMISRGEW
jgi:DNA-binding CsgD family transcriptional regulator